MEHFGVDQAIMVRTTGSVGKKVRITNSDLLITNLAQPQRRKDKRGPTQTPAQRSRVKYLV